MPASLQADRRGRGSFLSGFHCGLLIAGLALASTSFAAGGGGGGGGGGRVKTANITRIWLMR
jgi:hypothetical protein